VASHSAAPRRVFVDANAMRKSAVRVSTLTALLRLQSQGRTTVRCNAFNEPLIVLIPNSFRRKTTLLTTSRLIRQSVLRISSTVRMLIRQPWNLRP
jgi:hypothetical protein